ncbi:lipocalin-like domain-containing protein [Caulobacter sp. LARHSG274]
MEDAQVTVNQLIGAWELVEWSEIHFDGTKTYPLGEEALGQLLYSEDGHVAAQLVRARRARFESNDWRIAASDEGARAFKEYFGYFGTYSVSLDRGAVVHHVKGAWFPNVEDSDQARRFKFENERLVLDADTDWGKVRIVWRRAKAWNPAKA